LGRTACTEHRCLYKGALYLTWSVVFGSLKGEKYNERYEREKKGMRHDNTTDK